MDRQQVYFFTATILGWKPILQNNRYKQLVLDSMAYLVNKNRCVIFGFVLMPNHIHLLWQMKETHKMADVQRDFLKFTGQMMKTDLEKSNSALLQEFYVNLKDRKYQIWKRNSLSIEMFSKEIMEQKLDYIHNNPVQGKWMLVNDLIGYKYSSVRFYENDEYEEYPFLSHYMECFE